MFVGVIVNICLPLAVGVPAIEQSAFKVKPAIVLIFGVLAHDDTVPPLFTKTWLNATPVLPGSVAVGATSTGLVLCSLISSFASIIPAGSRPVATTG